MRGCLAGSELEQRGINRDVRVGPRRSQEVRSAWLYVWAPMVATTRAGRRAGGAFSGGPGGGAPPGRP
eukprot:12341966-Alexandrium_andersonii.AAC.1